jgi:hypothetical protein
MLSPILYTTQLCKFLQPYVIIYIPMYLNTTECTFLHSGLKWLKKALIEATSTLQNLTQR